MNLLLVDPTTDRVDGRRVTVTGERARHVRKVLRLDVGGTLRCGIVGGGVGTGRIVASAPGAVTVELGALDGPPPPKIPVHLWVAMPRPPMFRRVLQTAATFGVSSMVFFASKRVEASYFGSRALSEPEIRRALCLGLAQARDTVPPAVRIVRRFEPAVERLSAFAGRRLLGEPEGAPCPCGVEGPVAVVVGPEGGFLSGEVAVLVQAGAEPVSLGGRPLRVDAAVAAFLGRLV